MLVFFSVASSSSGVSTPSSFGSVGVGSGFSNPSSRSDKTYLDKEEETTAAAVIIKKNSGTRNSSGLKSQEAFVDGDIFRPKSEVVKGNNPLDELPLFETYEEQKKAKTPFLCVPCNKKLTRSSLSSHLRSKHPKTKHPKVSCCICDAQFDSLSGANEHLSENHKVFPCHLCDHEEGGGESTEAFSEFDKLKNHLKTHHEGAQWPFICGFCDLVLLYQLEFEVHVSAHTLKSPFSCPLCSR